MENNETSNEKFDGELMTTKNGLLRFSSSCWNKMDEKERDFVREYNAAVKHDDPLDKVTTPKGITIKNVVRRTPKGILKPPTKKHKAITFGIGNEYTDKEKNEE